MIGFIAAIAAVQFIVGPALGPDDVVLRQLDSGSGDITCLPGIDGIYPEKRPRWMSADEWSPRVIAPRLTGIDGEQSMVFRADCQQEKTCAADIETHDRFRRTRIAINAILRPTAIKISLFPWLRYFVPYKAEILWEGTANYFRSVCNKTACPIAECNEGILDKDACKGNVCPTLPCPLSKCFPARC